MSFATARVSNVFSGDQVGLGLAGSLLVHVLLVAGVAFWPASGNNNRIYLAPAYNVRLLAAPPAPPAPPAAAPKAAVPVKKPEPTAVKPQPQPKPQPKPAEAIGTKKQEAKPEPKPKRIKPKVDPAQAERELSRRLAQLERRTQSRRQVDSAISRIQSRVASRASAAGGVAGSAGGGGGDKTSMRFQVYHTEVWQRIRTHWIVPEAMIKSTRGLETIVVIIIRRNGSLAGVRLEKSSGNTRYDQTALRAVKKAGPYPPLPIGYRRATYEMGVRFRPEDHT